jgi:uncharacterized membrane protein YbhN (UPF0104 family)
MQMQMQIMLIYQHTNAESWTLGIDNGIFVWRSFTSYLPAIIGFGGFVIYLISFGKAAKRRQTFLQK